MNHEKKSTEGDSPPPEKSKLQGGSGMFEEGF